MRLYLSRGTCSLRGAKKHDNTVCVPMLHFSLFVAGQYGQVFLGRLLDRSSTQQMPVAIKTMKEDSSTKQEAIEFLQEATLMKDFKHDNIMSLIGVVIEHDKAFVLLPFMENGDLRTFISNDGNVSSIKRLCQ